MHDLAWRFSTSAKRPAIAKRNIMVVWSVRPVFFVARGQNTSRASCPPMQHVRRVFETLIFGN
jgi:hypothetical protein